MLKGAQAGDIRRRDLFFFVFILSWVKKFSFRLLKVVDFWKMRVVLTPYLKELQMV